MSLYPTASLIVLVLLCSAPLPAALAATKKTETIRETVPRTAEQEEAHRHYVEGAGHFLERRFSEAVAAFTRSLEIEPESAEVRFALGNSYFENGQTLEALREWRSALKYDPNLVEALIKTGDVYREQGDAALAMEQYQKALQRRPDDFAALTAIGTLHHENGDLKEAETLLERAAELNPGSAEAHDRLGLLYHDRKYRKASVASFKKAIKTAPDRAAFHDHLAKAYFERSRDSGANTQEIGEKLKKKAGDKGLKQKLAISKRNERLYAEKAVDAWKKAISIDETDPEMRTNLAMTLQLLGKLDEAIGEYRRAAIAQPGDARARVRLGDALLLRNEPIDALYFYDEALAIDPSLYDVHFQRGLAYKAKNLVPEATAAFEAYIAAAPAEQKEKKNKAQQHIRILNFVPKER